MSSAVFPIQPINRFAGQSEPVKRPKEFTCYSYDAKGQYRPDDSSIRWYYEPRFLPVDLSKGFDKFVPHDASVDRHLDDLLKTIVRHEKETGKRIDANIVTWRGMMTKIVSAPYEKRDGFEMNATLYRDCIFIEENHAYRKVREEADLQASKARKSAFPIELMSYWGYKFETVSTIPDIWARTSREYIEGRDDMVVNNELQYCSVVRTGIGKTILCLGGEVDAMEGVKGGPGEPTKWVEFKTTSEIRNDRDRGYFQEKLLKYWVQSFLLGVPKIAVGFRDRKGMLVSIEEIETQSIPQSVPRDLWDGDTCINFASAFLDWLRQTITDEGVWRIRREPGAPNIELFKVEEVGHGRIITDEFMDWRIALELRGTEPEPAPSEPLEET
ncbi:RAI1 like PD-XK nuclease-domain-containing protein [Echria macrotheca]|uniref:Decapping nuclease n=1 Tax=Echria macrotheca TaxID=438768 RepID=A0AAJ0BP92_9PEZI|nr:RAI1 like PD-XK nuclease-domain-containing protein [Echria macrotheca]